MGIKVRKREPIKSRTCSTLNLPNDSTVAISIKIDVETKCHESALSETRFL